MEVAKILFWMVEGYKTNRWDGKNEKMPTPTARAGIVISCLSFGKNLAVRITEITYPPDIWKNILLKGTWCRLTKNLIHQAFIGGQDRTMVWSRTFENGCIGQA